MNEADIQEIITDAISDRDETMRIRTFEEAGVLTRNNGLVVRTSDGSEFQITIVQSR